MTQPMPVADKIDTPPASDQMEVVPESDMTQVMDGLDMTMVDRPLLAAIEAAEREKAIHQRRVTPYGIRTICL